MVAAIVPNSSGDTNTPNHPSAIRPMRRSAAGAALRGRPNPPPPPAAPRAAGRRGGGRPPAEPELEVGIARAGSDADVGQRPEAPGVGDRLAAPQGAQDRDGLLQTRRALAS